MGTRHVQSVIAKNGELKIKQYGQWDGHPDGQGIKILEYLRGGNLDKYQDELIKIPLINDEQIKTVEADNNWPQTYPYLSRDCGSNIHKMIEDGEVKFASHLKEDDWCEGFYTIDFSKNEFTSSYYDATTTFKLNELPSNEDYIKLMKTKDDDEDE